MSAGLGFVWGSFRLGKGLTSKMLSGGFQVDFESLGADLREVRGPVFAVAFGVLQGCGCASFGLVWVVWGNAINIRPALITVRLSKPNNHPKPAPRNSELRPNHSQ